MLSEEKIESPPFENDLLDRKSAAEFLTKYLVGRYNVAGSVPGNESFVLNVNAEWGLGKTYFLTEWAKMLRIQGHFVVTFDAWKNDYAKDPFVGFMSAIKCQIKEGLPKKRRLTAKAKAMLNTGARVIKNTAPSLAFSVVKQVSGIDFQQDVIRNIEGAVKNSTEKIISIVESDLIKQNENIKESIDDFRKSFADFAVACEVTGGIRLPIFLMIDELDRCRPSYSIELLEKIKHIFGVENVYTIIATDSEQLSHSINAVYGGNFDSKKYLRRFFDHESRLDNPDFKKLATAAMRQRNMAEDKRLISIRGAFHPEETNAEVLAALGQYLRVTTRDFLRAIDIIDTIRITQNETMEAIYLGFLVMVFVSHNDAFDDYKTRPRNILELLHERVDHGISWIEFRENRDSRPSRIDSPVHEWMRRYIDGIWSEKPFENSDTYLSVRESIRQLGRTNNSQLNQSNLRRYHKTISIAGNFSL